MAGALLFGMVLDDGAVSQSPSEGHPNAAPTQTGSQQAAPGQAPVAAPEQEQPASPDYRYECEHPKSREEADSCQQRRSADVAAESLTWTRMQTWLGGAGVIGSFLSAVFTAWAAWAAARAARAAESSVLIARQIGEAQVRSYISIQSVEIYFGGDTGMPFVEIVAANSGQSPALNFVWQPVLRYLPDVNADITYVGSEEWMVQPGVDISPASEVSQIYVADGFNLVDRVTQHTKLPPHLPVSVMIEFGWTDVFGRRIYDLASFAGMAEERRSKPNPDRHPLNTSRWVCQNLWPVEKGKAWTGIAVKPEPSAAQKRKRDRLQSQRGKS